MRVNALYQIKPEKLLTCQPVRPDNEYQKWHKLGRFKTIHIHRLWNGAACFKKGYFAHCLIINLCHFFKMRYKDPARQKTCRIRHLRALATSPLIRIIFLLGFSSPSCLFFLQTLGSIVNIHLPRVVFYRNEIYYTLPRKNR